MKQSLQLKNISCQNCANHVSRYFMDLENVQEVKIDLEHQQAIITTKEAYHLEDYQTALGKTIYQVLDIW